MTALPVQQQEIGGESHMISSTTHQIISQCEKNNTKLIRLIQLIT